MFNNCIVPASRDNIQSSIIFKGYHIKRIVTSRSRGMMIVPLCSAWSSESRSGVHSTGRTWSGFNADHEVGHRGGTPHLRRQAKEVAIFHPGYEKVLRRSLWSLSVQKGDYEKEGEGYLIRKYSDWTMENGFKLKKYVQREFFTVKTVRHWNCLPREVVDIQSQEGSEDELNGALSNPIQWVTSLSVGRRSELDDF